MKHIVTGLNLSEQLDLANRISGEYSNDIIYHAYWNGNFNEKHFLSIKSCFLTNIKHSLNRKIIVWIENNSSNKWTYEIEKYAEIIQFNLEYEIKNTPLDNKQFYYNKVLSFYSDVVRYILLYKYAGCWFDLDIFFLRDFGPVFSSFKDEVMVYQWENQNYPNGAIYISLQPESKKLREVIEFIIEQNKGWGFQEANINYNLPLDLLVLPCSWFDAGWLPSPEITCDMFFKKTNKHITLDTFYKGAFCFHWHNRWNTYIENDSPCYQLINLLDNQ